MQIEEISSTALLMAIATASVMALSCSTAAGPPPSPPLPQCNCDVGERQMDCGTGAASDITDVVGQPTSSSYVYLCIDEDASDEDKTDACIASCNEWLGGVAGLHCGFFDTEDPFPWTDCSAPANATGG